MSCVQLAVFVSMHLLRYQPLLRAFVLCSDTATFRTQTHVVLDFQDVLDISMLILKQEWDLSITESCSVLQHVWISLAFSRWVGEFTVSSLSAYNPDVHLNSSDLAFAWPHCSFPCETLQSKTDLFQQHISGCNWGQCVPHQYSI